LIASLPKAQRDELLADLNDDDAGALLYDWRGWWGRPKQFAPGTAGAHDSRTNWRYWLVKAGRGFGKTRTGAEAAREAVEKHGRIHLVGPTVSDVRDVMVEGESGLLSVFPPHQRPIYEPSKRLINFHTGAVAYCFSADEPERLRGPQCEWGWADELAAWRYPEAWDQFLFGLRLGSDPRAVITTTPKPTQLVRDLVKHPATVVTNGSTYENRSNLAPGWFSDIIKKYEGSRVGRQELEGELLDDFPGALWTRSVIDSARIRPEEVHWDMITRVVVAIDPAVTANEGSDETGIITAALTRSEHVLVLDDDSCKESPLGWARVAVGRYKMRQADRIVAEVNNGGDLVAANLYTVAPEVPFRAVRASRGKATRAEPVAALYEQGRVHHVGQFNTLEDQLCEYVPGVTEKSPDRMDALVWAITELIIDPEEQEIAFIRDRDWYTISPI
jgi:phage terminase large subunit-like protein